jgi:predicted RNA polymerase sigma factor
MKLGRPAEAAQEFARAASLTGNAAERELSTARAREAGEQARAQGAPGR